MAGWVPFVQFTITAFGTFLALTATSPGNDFWNVIAFSMAAQLVFISSLMFKVLPDAIRYVNPSWDFVPSGGRLWPFFFYWFMNPPTEEELNGEESDTTTQSQAAEMVDERTEENEENKVEG